MKKLLLTLGTLGSIAAPIAAVVSCGSDTKVKAKPLNKATKEESNTEAHNEEINSVQPESQTATTEQTQVQQPEANNEEVQTQTETTTTEATNEVVEATETPVSHSYTFKNKQEFISTSFDEVIDKIAAWVKEHDKGADFKRSNEGNIFRRSKGNKWSVYNLFDGENKDIIQKLKDIELSDQYAYDSLEDAVSALKALSDEVKATIFIEWNPALSGEFKETSATLEALKVKETTTVAALNPSIIDTNSFETQNVGIIGNEDKQKEILNNFAKEVEGSLFTTDLTDQALEALSQNEVSTFTAEELYIAGFKLPEGAKGKFMVWKNESNVFVLSGEITLGAVHKSVSGIILVGTDKATHPSYATATPDIYQMPSLAPNSNVEQLTPHVPGSHPEAGELIAPPKIATPEAAPVANPQITSANSEQVVVPPVATTAESATHTYTFNGVDDRHRPHGVSAADLTADSYDGVIDKIVAHIKAQDHFSKGNNLIFRKNKAGEWAIWDIPGKGDALVKLGLQENTQTHYVFNTIDAAADALKALTDEQKATIFTQID